VMVRDALGNRKGRSWHAGREGMSVTRRRRT